MSEKFLSSKCGQCQLAVAVQRGSYTRLCAKHDVMVSKCSRACSSFRAKTPAWLLEQQRMVQL